MSSGDKKSHYEQYLANLHSGLVTPEELISETIKEATGRQLADKKRIVAGEVNEVYDVALDNGGYVILRISREVGAFDREKWAIEQCKKIDVPAPDILLIKHLQTVNQPLSLCVQEKMEGEPLERGSIDYHQLDPVLVRRLVVKAGEMLARIHSIPTMGFGRLNGQGQGRFKSLHDLMAEKVSQRELFMKLAKDLKLDQKVIEEAIKIFAGHLNKIEEIEPHLSHGDYAFKHIMVKGEEIVGILDWGEVTGNSSVNDFARWDYWFKDELPTEWLQEGYTNKALFDENFEDMLHWYRINIGLENLWWYHDKDYPQAIDRIKEKLLKDLEYYK